MSLFGFYKYQLTTIGDFMSKKIYRAGIIPYYQDGDNIKMMFMIPAEKKFSGKEPQIAKGKMEDGESELETALREGKEELGLYKGNLEDIYELGKFLGRTTIFVARVKDVDMFGDPHFETESTKWMSPEEFQKSGRNLHKPIIKAAVRYIEKRNK